MTKKYQPPEEHYEFCGECTFCSGMGCFFCEHPDIKDMPQEERMVLRFNRDYYALDQWESAPIPEWCPLEDVEEKVIIKQRKQND